MGELFRRGSDRFRIATGKIQTINALSMPSKTTFPSIKGVPSPEYPSTSAKWRKSLAKVNAVEKFSQKQEYRKREKEVSEQEKLLRSHEGVKNAKSIERQRQKNFRLKQKAAFRIQKAWKKYKMRQFGILTVAKQSIHQLQTQTGAEEFQKQIAALTIQLAWRKYYRRKLLRSLTPNRRQLHLWDPEVIAMKQKALVKQIYGEAPPVPFWHPAPKKPARPYWSKWVPSAAALSYNFAVDRYHPLVSKKGFLPSPFIDPQGYPKNFDWNPLEDEDLANNLRSVRVPNTTQSRSRQYSYNISRGGNGYRSSSFV